MASKIQRLENWFSLETIGSAGELIEVRDMKNVPLPELYPDHYVAMVDWLYGREDNSMPRAEELLTPIKYKDVAGVERTLDGWRYWGSSGIKNGRTYAVEAGDDFFVEDGPLSTVERTLMFGRALMNPGIFGGLKGSLRVYVVPQGTVINGHPVADGHSLIRRDLAELGSEPEMPKIRMGGKAKPPTQFWPRIKWTPELEAEVLPVIKDTMIAMSDSSKRIERKDATWEERQKLCQIDKEMSVHPYIASALSRCSADDFYRAAISIDVPFNGYVLVPTHEFQDVATAEKGVIIRYPADSPSSIQAVEGSTEHPEELERIANLELIQYTIISKSVMAKGMFGVVDELPYNADIVLCEEDIKLGKLRRGINRVNGAVVAFNMWFDRGSAIGVNPKWAKGRLGADFDGDYGFFANTDKFPVLHAQCKELGATDLRTGKIAKTKTLIVENDLRAEFAAACMKLGRLVGLATNLLFATYVRTDRENIANALGFKTETQMDKIINRLVKVGTDGFKTLKWSQAFTRKEFESFSEDRQYFEKYLATLQGNLITELGCMPPWQRWPNQWAFTRGIPRFAHEEDLDQNEKANAVPTGWDGTVVKILEITLPNLREAVRQTIEVKPLSAFRDWAPMVPKEVYDVARELVKEFNSRVHRTNFQVYDDVVAFKRWWQARAREWAKTLNLPREQAAAALWRVCHNTRSQNATGAPVFMAFPEECAMFVREKPGVTEALLETLLVGLAYQFERPPTNLVTEVIVKEFTQIKKGKKIIRKIICGDVPGKKPARDPYPTDLIGFVEMSSTQPEVGEYLAQIVKAGKGQAWHCRLTPIEEASGPPEAEKEVII